MPETSLFNGASVLSYARVVSSAGVDIQILAPCTTVPLAFGDVTGEFGEVVGHANTVAVIDKQGNIIAHLVRFLIEGKSSCQLILLTDAIFAIRHYYN